MTDEIIFRTLRKEDYSALADVIRETWHYDDFCTPKAARRLAKAYLYACLSEQTYTNVALSHGVPVGVIMGRNHRKRPTALRFGLRAALCAAPLFFSAEGREVIKFSRKISQIDSELLKSSRLDDSGELVFFALRADFRKKGIGRDLFEHALQYMQKENIPRFFLYTDTSCNYGFYECMGMKRRAEKNIFFDYEETSENMTFFVYEYRFV
mgnify:CR=1 FL=1